MKRKIFYLFIIILFLGSCNLTKSKKENSLLVFCAASLTDVVSEIVNDFEGEQNVTVKLNLASSGTLARQIENGADPDLFISANKKWLDYLLERNLLSAKNNCRVAGNQMVLIAPKTSELRAVNFSEDLNLAKLFEGRLSIGDPQHVPAGSYAVQLLEKIGCLQDLEPRFLPAKDVRSALMVVELGEVDAGIVYKTDALKSDKVKIITTFPENLHKPAIYYMATTKDEKNNRSLQLYNYIVSDKTKPVWEKYGFKQ